MSISPRTEDLRDAGFHFGPTPPIARKNGDGLVDERELWLDTSGPVLRWWDGGAWQAVDGSNDQVVALGRIDTSAVLRALTVQDDQTVTLGRIDTTATLRALAVDAPDIVTLGRIDTSATLRALTVQADKTVDLGRIDTSLTQRALTVDAGGDLTSEQLDDSPDFLYVASDVSGTTANDQTANGRDGTLVGGVGTADGFVFDGTDDWIDSGYAPGTVGDCTWEMLVKIPADAVGSGHRWFGLVGQDGSYNQMYTTSGDGFPLFLWRKGSSGPEDLGSSAEAFDDDTWRLVTVTLESATGQVDIWVDGVFQSGKNRHTGPWAFGTTRIAIGDVMLDDNTAGGFNFEGHLENFAFYQSVLSDARIEAHAEAAGFTVP